MFMILLCLLLPALNAFEQFLFSVLSVSTSLLHSYQHHSFFHNCNLQFIGLVQPGTRHLFYCWCQRDIETVSCSKTLHHECVSKLSLCSFLYLSFIAESKLLHFPAMLSFSGRTVVSLLQLLLLTTCATLYLPTCCIFSGLIIFCSVIKSFSKFPSLWR